MKVLLLIVLSVVFASAPSFAQQDSVSVQILNLLDRIDP